VTRHRRLLVAGIATIIKASCVPSPGAKTARRFLRQPASLLVTLYIRMLGKQAFHDCILMRGIDSPAVKKPRTLVEQFDDRIETNPLLHHAAAEV
jgi:hypothetical protein